MSDGIVTQEEPPLVCLLGEDDAGRAEEEARARLIMSKAERIDEVADGYAFHIPTPDAMLGTIAEFLAFERWCCPFITFELDLAPNRGPLTLRMRGPAAFKDFLREEIATHLGMDITAAEASGVGMRLATDLLDPRVPGDDAPLRHTIRDNLLAAADLCEGLIDLHEDVRAGHPANHASRHS